ncbi:hypothetical protein [Nocardioides ferulae]|uniref:hypothetical protein n=1 Tax=Nocardioides ferulae TaxID=2340821 RepID=UPI000F868868|nr:hypothetical protein [Nocardioides ferulae]
MRTRPVRLLVALVALLLVPACDAGADRDLRPEEEATSAMPPEDIAATPSVPSWSGSRALVLVAGSRVLTPLACTPAPEAGLICTADGDTYATAGTSQRATLVGAEARLDEGHTSWQSAFRFAAGSERALVRAQESAQRAGELLLFQVPDGPVVAAIPVPRVNGRTLLLARLDKADAWGFVRAVAEE